MALPAVTGTSSDPLGAGNPTGVVDVSFLLRRSDGHTPGLLITEVDGPDAGLLLLDGLDGAVSRAPGG